MMTSSASMSCLGSFLLIISCLIVTVLTAQPRVMPVDPSTLPTFTPERSFMEEMQMNKWASVFTKFEPDLIKRRLTTCVKRRSLDGLKVDDTATAAVKEVDSLKFLTYRFRAQWPTPNSPVSDYTTQFPTYLFTIQVNDDEEFWHLKIIDLNRCCSIKKTRNGQDVQNRLDGAQEEEEEEGETGDAIGRLKKYRIVGLKAQETRDVAGTLTDFFDNDCPAIVPPPFYV